MLEYILYYMISLVRIEVSYSLVTLRGKVYMYLLNLKAFSGSDIVFSMYTLMNYRLLEFGSINCVRHCPQT
jgi:hypothetical protein